MLYGRYYAVEARACRQRKFLTYHYRVLYVYQLMEAERWRYYCTVYVIFFARHQSKSGLALEMGSIKATYPKLILNSLLNLLF